MTARSLDLMEETSRTYRRYALFMLLAVFTTSHVDRHILNILLEAIRAEFVLSDTELGLLSGVAFAIFYATLGLPVAMWADRGNRRNIIILALSLWSAMTALCGLAQSFIQLLLFRIGVGVGEAGSNPPSHSMISDLFPPNERATAMGIFGAGANLGVLIGFPIGGWLNQFFGWRTAFLAVGIPGLILAAVVAMTVREPRRGAADGLVGKPARAPSLWAVFAHMARSRALVLIILAGTTATFVAYAAVAWLPAYLLRTFDVQTGLVGTTLSLMMGGVGAAGTFSGGIIADRLARRDPRWRVWFGSVALLFGLPFLIAMLFATSFWAAIFLYALPAFVGIIYLGPTFALIQGLVPIHMRSVAASINLFIGNLVGLGLGPLTVGILSDLYGTTTGAASLRYAILTVSMLWIVAAVLFFFSGKTLQSELDAVARRQVEGDGA